MDTKLVFEKEERYQYMIDTSTILNSMKSIKLFVKYNFNEQLRRWEVELPFYLKWMLYKFILAD